MCKISKCALLYKRIHGGLPGYLNDHIVVNNQRHSRNTRYSNSNIICRSYNREKEGGRTFAVTSTRLWNVLPLDLRNKDSLMSFKNNMWNSIFKHQ